MQVYHREKKKVIVNVPVYLKRNNFRGNLFSQIKNVGGKLFSWMSSNQACQGIRVSHISIFVLYLISMEKDLSIKKLVKNLRN